MNTQSRDASKGHLAFIDLKNNGLVEQVAVIKEDTNGDIYYIAINELDDIDRERLTRILKLPNANSYPLYELMSHHTLQNGQNALEFFHQLVKIRTNSGHIIPVGSGRMGSFKKSEQSQIRSAAAVARGRGRPPKASE